MSQSKIQFFICSHIGIADSLPTTAYVKMIDIFMIFTMTVPLLEIIGHTYSVYLKKKLEELDSLYDPPKLPLASPPGSVSISIQPFDGNKFENLPQIKSKLFAHDKRSGALLPINVHVLLICTIHPCLYRRKLERRLELCVAFQDWIIPILATGAQTPKS